MRGVKKRAPESVRPEVVIDHLPSPESSILTMCGQRRDALLPGHHVMNAVTPDLCHTCKIVRRWRSEGWMP